MVNDESDIRLVDAHSKGNSCNDDVNTIMHPLVLDLFLLFLRYISMVESCSVPSTIEGSTHLLALTLGKTVYDATLILVLVHYPRNVFQHILCLLSHFIVEIRTVER